MFMFCLFFFLPFAFCFRLFYADDCTYSAWGYVGTQLGHCFRSTYNTSQTAEFFSYQCNGGECITALDILFTNFGGWLYLQFAYDWVIYLSVLSFEMLF